MSSKERERLNFNWQRSNNQYMVLLTIIIASISFLNSVPDKFKIYLLWTLGFAISLFGLSVINLNADELVYTWKGLRDRRANISKFKKITTIGIYLFVCLTGFCIILLGGYLLMVLAGVLANPLA